LTAASPASRSDSTPALQPPVRLRDAARTRAEILEVATREFAQRGYSGARVDEIAARTRTTKRMLYYYFGSKEGLYIAVLECAYGRIREAERTVDVEHLHPVEAIRRLAELTFDHHEAHPDFIRLVSIENIHRAEHMRKSTALARLNTTAVEVIARILDAGRASGVFRREVDALDVHMLISAYCVFRVANRFTFGTLFGRDLGDGARREHYRHMLGDVVVAFLTGSEQALDTMAAAPARAKRAPADRPRRPRK
jgi:AcrR family transcriptional regulator